MVTQYTYVMSIKKVQENEAKFWKNLEPDSSRGVVLMGVVVSTVAWLQTSRGWAIQLK